MSPSYYQRMMLRVAEILPATLRPVFLHPAGPATIFFWAPTFKWALVIAGIGDINRSPEKISIGQTASLLCTGLVWSRYSLVIVPKNWNLFGVNAFVGLSSGYNFARAMIHRLSTTNE